MMSFCSAETVLEGMLPKNRHELAIDVLLEPEPPLFWSPLVKAPLLYIPTH